MNLENTSIYRISWEKTPQNWTEMVRLLRRLDIHDATARESEHEQFRQMNFLTNSVENLRNVNRDHMDFSVVVE